jgi:hypothetical protein
MTQEQLRMQMLAGIITEGQYKEKMKPEFKQIEAIMDRYKTQDPIKSFKDFAYEVEKELDMEFYNNLQWANPSINGFRHLFVWAIDNVASNPSQESNIPKKNIIYQGGPGNSWILRSWR